MSTDNLHDDAEFERFLAGEGELSRQLKGMPQAEPSAELDAAVFASIEAAMAAEKVQVVEPEPRGAANDPIGPATIPPQRRRSLAYYWHWPVGVAAGILLTLAYRTAFHPYQAPDMALNESMQSRVISPTPRVTEQPDVITEPGRVATAPAVIEPPDMAAQPAPSSTAAAPAQPLVAAASVKEGATPEGNVRVEEKKMQAATVTGSPIARRDSESQSPIQVVTVSDSRAAGKAEASKPPTGVELAWTRDPVQEAAAARAAKRAESAPQLAAAAPSLPPTAAPVSAAPPPAAAPVSVAAPAPVQEVAASKSEPAAKPDLAVASPALANRLARAQTDTRDSASVTYGIIGPSTNQEALEYSPSPSTTALRANSPTGSESGFAAVPQSTTPSVLGGNTGQFALEESRQAAASPKADLAKPDPSHADPRKWLAKIEQEIKHKHDQAALAEWDQFVAAHPSYKVKAKLRAAIKALRDRQPAEPAPAGSK